MSKRDKYKNLFLQINPGAGILLVIITLMLLTNGVALVIPWIAGTFTETLIREESSTSLGYNTILFLWFLLLLLHAALSFFSNYLSGKTSEKMLANLRDKLYGHLQSLPMAFYHDHKQGKILALLANDAAIISNFISHTLVSLIPHAITACGGVICIFFISPLIALLIALLVPFFYLATKLLGRRIGPVTKEMVRAYGDTFAIVEENLANLAIIKSFTRETVEQGRFRKRNHRLRSLATEYHRLEALLSPTLKFLATSLVLFTLWVMSERIISGEIAPSELVRILLYGLLLTQPVSGFANIYGQIQRFLGAAEQILDVLSVTGEDTATGQRLASTRGEITFTNVTFNYPDRENILEDFNLTIAAGETLAITGKNGVGKSTLAHLLIRYMDPMTGSIHLDGQDIKDFSLLSLRNHIGIVQQQVLLQNTTIEKNIGFSMPDASSEAIHLAAKKAHAYDFIQKLPKGFQTIIGDQGVKLSGGQKQRLSLARVLLKDPVILIFDEATAMFDPAGEEQFITECRSFLASKTVILITHRPGSLILADRIVEISQGKAIERPKSVHNSTL